MPEYGNFCLRLQVELPEMPELPEVETIARMLSPKISGCSIREVHIACTGRQLSPGPADFCSLLKKCRILSVSRRAKYLRFDLERNSTPAQLSLLVHLRMSGRLDVFEEGSPRAKHDRVCFRLDDGRELRFNDVRRFGRLSLCEDPERELSHLGPEPLAADLKPAQFARMLKERKTAIKPLLLNQSFIAGIGNIYADESLWFAGIHPQKSAARVSEDRARLLFSSIRRVLRDAIRHHGTDFGDKVVDFGRHVPKIYGQTGKPCPRCGTAIKRIVVAQRGTHYCAACQR